MDKIDEKVLENPKEILITYRDKEVKIGDLTDEEKNYCISKLWISKGVLENEREVLQEMIQKMYFFGKMEKIDEENS